MKIKTIKTYRNKQGAQFRILSVPIFYLDNDPLKKEYPRTEAELRDMLKDKRLSYSGFFKHVTR